ncbi:hypothetical protein GGR56DRAFT_672992 [Xylariaceae sp. FL0804]|nr:hypothetical protein GGR56DRAFT_672992 [Xylariaceae sp. FL0804]
MTLDLAARRRACEDTIRRSADVAAATPGGSLASVFVPAQLPPLTLLPPSRRENNHPAWPSATTIAIHDSDAFALARILAEPPPTQEENGEDGNGGGGVAVLNLANDQEPGGGWRYTLSFTQEEALCYSSTLYATLRPEWYPFPDAPGPTAGGPAATAATAGIVSPGVVVFRDTLDRGLAELLIEERSVVTVITVAAPCRPALSADGTRFASEVDRAELREKILLVLRASATHGATRLVLGAMGCGAFGCPPEEVAPMMRDALARDEFAGWFETVAFAVYAAGPAGRRNLDVFRDQQNRREKDDSGATIIIMCRKCRIECPCGAFLRYTPMEICDKAIYGDCPFVGGPTLKTTQKHDKCGDCKRQDAVAEQEKRKAARK